MFYYLQPTQFEYVDAQRETVDFYIMFEILAIGDIDIYVRTAIIICTQETFEREREFQRVDIRNADEVVDKRTCRSVTPRPDIDPMLLSQFADFFFGETGNNGNGRIRNALFSHRLRHFASFVKDAFGNLRVDLVREFLKEAVLQDIVIPFFVEHLLVCLEFFLAKLRHF